MKLNRHLRVSSYIFHCISTLQRSYIVMDRIDNNWRNCYSFLKRWFLDLLSSRLCLWHLIYNFTHSYLFLRFVFGLCDHLFLLFFLFFCLLDLLRLFLFWYFLVIFADCLLFWLRLRVFFRFLSLLVFWHNNLIFKLISLYELNRIRFIYQPSWPNEFVNSSYYFNWFWSTEGFVLFNAA